MKLVGIRHRRHVWIAVQLDGTVSPIAEVDDCYSDIHRYLDQARGLTHGGLPTSEIVLAPPVPTSARVICVGLNYRAHAAEGHFEGPLHVGYLRNPPWYLEPGDAVEVEVERLGMIRTLVVAASERP